MVVYDPDGACVHRHDRGSRIVLAKRLAALKQFSFCGDYDASADYQAPVYFVPCEPLVGHELCRRLGIANEDDLFGGIVPHRFVGTKAVVHPLVDAAARAPDGWSADFARRVADLVLQGYTAFTIEDARRAGARLLERHGCARVKRVSCCGGRGQHVALDRAALDDILTRLDPADVAEAGVVVEENLTEVTTYSVGLVSVADLQVSYYGTQRTTPDNEGRAVYGGSDLTLIRGGFGELERQHVPDEVKRAIKSAHAFDRAAEACFAG